MVLEILFLNVCLFCSEEATDIVALYDYET